MQEVKQSTNRNVMVFMTDSSDHVTGKTGLTLTITASKDGAAFASISPTVTERGNGWYNVALTTSHTDTLGDLALHVTSAGADATDKLLCVVSELSGVVASILANAITASAIASSALNGKGDWNIGKTGYSLSASGVQAIWDALTSALTTVGSIGKLLVDNIDATISSRLSSASYTAPLDALGTRSAVGLASANLDTQLADLPTANENADALLDRANAIETGWSVRGILRLIASVLLGKVSGGGTGTEVFRNVTDSKDRVTSVNDVNGNRTSVTLDGS